MCLWMISIQCLAVKRISVHYFCPHSSMQRDPWQAARDLWPSPLIPRTNDATAVMSQIAFSKIPSFQNMMNVSTILGLDTKLNRDSLYDDLVETKSVFESITSQSTASMSVTQKWQQYFTVCMDSAVMGVGLLVNVFRIVSTALYIPGSSTFCERVFFSNECN